MGSKTPCSARGLEAGSYGPCAARALRGRSAAPFAKKGLRGFIFSIDAALAVFLFALLLFTSAFLSAQASSDAYGKLQVVHAGKDALAIADKQGALSSGNATIIEGALLRLLPPNIGMHVGVSTYYYYNGTFGLLNTSEYGEEIPGNITVYGASREFVAMRNGQVSNYSVARMSIWQK